MRGGFNFSQLRFPRPAGCALVPRSLARRDLKEIVTRGRDGIIMWPLCPTGAKLKPNIGESGRLRAERNNTVAALTSSDFMAADKNVLLFKMTCLLGGVADIL